MTWIKLNVPATTLKSEWIFEREQQQRRRRWLGLMQKPAIVAVTAGTWLKKKSTRPSTAHRAWPHSNVSSWRAENKETNLVFELTKKCYCWFAAYSTFYLALRLMINWSMLNCFTNLVVSYWRCRGVYSHFLTNQCSGKICQPEDEISIICQY